MASYKVLSRNWNGHYTELQVEFNDTPAQRYEIKSDDDDVIDEVLSKVALAAEPKEVEVNSRVFQKPLELNKKIVIEQPPDTKRKKKK